MDATTTKVTSLILRLTEKNYAKWNWNISVVVWKQNFWKYIQSAWALDEEVIEIRLDGKKNVMETANLMTPTITALILAELTKEEFNDGYKMYKCLKKLLQLLGKTQIIHLTWEYYMLNYHNYKNISNFLNYVKSLENQIDAMEVKMTPNKQRLLYLTMALLNEVHYQSLI